MQQGRAADRRASECRGPILDRATQNAWLGAFRLTRVINRGLVKPTGTASATVSTRDCVFAATTTSNIIKSTAEAVQGTQESRESSRVCECSEF